LSEIHVINLLTFHSGKTLEETAALFDGEEEPRDLIAMGGQAADIAMKINRDIVPSDPKSAQQKLDDKKGRVLRIEKRNGDVNFTLIVDLK